MTAAGAVGRERLGRFPAVLVAVLAAATLPGLAGCSVPSGRQTHVDHRTFPVPIGGHTTLSVKTFNGHISVTAIGEGTADVSVTAYGTATADDEAQAALASVQVITIKDGDALNVTVQPHDAAPLMGSRGADVDVALPQNADLTLVTSNGRIEAVNVKGSIMAGTSNGDVVTRGGRGIQVETSNAAVTLSQPSGPIAVTTSNGSVDVLNADRAVANVQSSNGPISFSGSLGEGDQSFGTSNASITLRFPSSQGFSIDGHTSNGSVTTDFAGLSASGSSIGGTAGDGSARVSAITSNGAMTVSQLKP